MRGVITKASLRRRHREGVIMNAWNCFCHCGTYGKVMMTYKGKYKPWCQFLLTDYFLSILASLQILNKKYNWICFCAHTQKEIWSTQEHKEKCPNNQRM